MLNTFREDHRNFQMPKYNGRKNSDLTSVRHVSKQLLKCSSLTETSGEDTNPTILAGHHAMLQRQIGAPRGSWHGSWQMGHPWAGCKSGGQDKDFEQWKMEGMFWKPMPRLDWMNKDEGKRGWWWFKKKQTQRSGENIRRYSFNKNLLRSCNKGWVPCQAWKLEQSLKLSATEAEKVKKM